MVALNTGEADAMSTLYAADAVRMLPEGPPSGGRETIRQNMSQFFETGSRDVQLQVEETEFSGELAYVMGTFALGVIPNDGSPRTDSLGHWMRLMRREPDGSWLIAYELWNIQA